MEWDGPKPTKESPVDGYNVYLREKGKKEWRKVTKEVTKKKSYTLKDLTQEVEYDAQVTAVNQAGESEPSQPSDTFKLQPKQNVPGAPKDLEVVDAQVDNVKLAWKAPDSDGNSPITGYVIEKKPQGMKTWQPAGKSPTAEFTIPAIEEGTYDFRVTAVNRLGPSKPTEIANVQVKAKMKLPRTPGQPEVSDITKTEATVSWPAGKVDAAAPVDGYDVFVREKGSKTWKKVTKSLVKGTRYVVTELEQLVEYEAQVTAVNEAGESEPSKPSAAFKLKKPERKGEKKIEKIWDFRKSS